jgi:hypothetical protein
MYRLICQKPAHFLSAQVALVSTFFSNVYSTWDVYLSVQYLFLSNLNLFALLILNGNRPHNFGQNLEIRAIVVSTPSQDFLVLRHVDLWQYRLWSFQGRDIKLERFLAINCSQKKLLNFDNWSCQKSGIKKNVLLNLYSSIKKNQKDSDEFLT